jgi:peptidoglycan/LPS O-acetylase OafA/YrhL
MLHLVSKQKNNFDFLRLLFASFVIFSHSYALLGLEHLEPFSVFSRGLALSSVAVMGFFVISGYLIYQSLLNSNSALIYLQKRFWRIMPGLVVVALLLVFVLGILFTNLSFKSYLSNTSTYKYFLKTILFLPTDNMLPGVFDNNPVPFVNGSLWTLRYEVLSYLSLTLLFAIPRRFYGKFIIIGTFCFFVLHVLINLNKLTVSVYVLNHLSNLCSLCFSFYAGALLAHFGKFWSSYKNPLFLCGLLVLTVLYFCPKVYWNIGLLAVLPLIVLYFGTAYSSILQIPKYLGDISYGTYIYAFPIQQALVATGVANVYLLLIFSLLLSWLAGYASFHLIEKRFIFRFKKAPKLLPA